MRCGSYDPGSCEETNFEDDGLVNARTCTVPISSSVSRRNPGGFEDIEIEVSHLINPSEEHKVALHSEGFTVNVSKNTGGSEGIEFEVANLDRSSTCTAPTS